MTVNLFEKNFQRMSQSLITIDNSLKTSIELLFLSQNDYYINILYLSIK